MLDISTTYLGMTVKNPIIVASSGLTSSVDKIKKLEDSEAGGIVLKSIFEEDIAFELDDEMKKQGLYAYNLEKFDYFDYRIQDELLDKYITLINDCKKQIKIPVIASINCTYSHEWALFANRIEAAGADALELNMFFLPSDFRRTSE